MAEAEKIKRFFCDERTSILQSPVYGNWPIANAASDTAFPAAAADRGLVSRSVGVSRSRPRLLSWVFKGNRERTPARCDSTLS
jgi:hypothetical protein